MSELTYPLKQALPTEQIEFVENALKASFAVSSVDVRGDKLTIVHDEQQPGDTIVAAVKRLVFIAKSIDKDLVFENPVDVRFEDDPQPALEARGDVRRVHPGFFTFQGEFLRVFHALNSAVRRIATDVDAIEQEYPTVWPVKLFREIDYLHEFPQQVILCAPVKDEFEARDTFARRYAKTEAFDAVPMDELMADAEYGLEPAVCDCCYFGMEGSSVTDAFYTCYNKVFRNERSASEQLDRLTNFSVRDIMFVGTEPFVLEARQQLIEKLSQFISQLGLRAKI